MKYEKKTLTLKNTTKGVDNSTSQNKATNYRISRVCILVYDFCVKTANSDLIICDNIGYASRDFILTSAPRYNASVSQYVSVSSGKILKAYSENTNSRMMSAIIYPF